MKKIRYLILCQLFVLLVIAGGANAQLNAPNTRSIGLGGSAVAMPEDPSVVFWNPAALSFFTRDQVIVNLNQQSELNYIGFTKYLPARFGFGVNVFRYPPVNQSQSSDYVTIGGGYRLNSALGIGSSINLGKKNNGKFISSFGLGLFLKSYPNYRLISVSKNPLWNWFRSQNMKDKLNIGIMVHNIPLVNMQGNHEFRFATMVKPLNNGPLFHFAYHISHDNESFHLGSQMSINQNNDIYFGFKDFDIKHMAIGFNTVVNVFSFELGFLPQSNKYFFSFSLLFNQKDEVISERYKHSGHQKIKSNDFNGGLSEYRKALAYDPDNEKINLLVSVLEDRVQEKEDKIDSLYNVAKDYLDKGWYVNAYHNYKKMLELDKSSKKAAKQLKKIRPELNRKLEQLYREGVKEYNDSDYTEAEKTFKRILSVNHSHEGANFYATKIDSIKSLTFSEYFYRGIGYYNQKNYKRAREELEKALALNPNHEEAKQFKEKAINAAAQRKERIQSLLRAAQQYEQNDQFVKANNRYRQVLELDSRNDFARKKVQYLKNYISAVVDSKFQKGKYLFNKKEYESAISVFSEIIAINPNHSASQRYLREARNEINKLQNEHYERALTLFKQKNYESALEECNKALAHGSAHLAAENLQKQILSNISIENLQKKGIEDFEKGDYLKAREAFGQILVKEPDHKIAGDYLKKSENRLKTRVEELFNQGMVNYSEGDYNAAIAIWDRILQIDPSHQKTLEYIQKASERLKALESIR